MSKQIVVFTENLPENLERFFEIRKGHAFCGLSYASQAFKEGWFADRDLNISEKKIMEILKENGLSFKTRYIVWEKGGGLTNTGHADIICSTPGEPLKPLYIRGRGHLACSNHAAFAVWEGQEAIRIHVYQHRLDYTIEITLLRATDKELEATPIWQASRILYSRVLEELPKKHLRFQEALKAAVEKAKCYHCREPHYIK